MNADEAESAPPKKSCLESLLMIGTLYILLGVVPTSLFCLVIAKDIEVKPVGPDFDPMRFGTIYSILLMTLLINAPIGALIAVIGRSIAATPFRKRLFTGTAIYMLLTFFVVGAAFLWA